MLCLLYGLLHLPRVQTYIVQKAAHSLEKKLGTPVRIESVDFRFFHLLSFKKLYIEDQQGDTLLFAGSALIRLNDWFFMKDKIVLKYIGLEDGFVQLQRQNKTWNYQYILDKLNPTDTSQKSSELSLDLQRVELSNIRFNMIDRWIGQNMLGAISHLDARIDSLDLQKNRFRIQRVSLDRPSFTIVDYKGTRTEAEAAASRASVTTTKSNLDLLVQQIDIRNGRFRNEDPTSPAPLAGQFDEWHIDFDAIDGTINQLQYRQDELLAKIQLKASERSGFNIQSLKANMLFNQNMMAFKDLSIKTAKSNIGDYFAMRYKHFNDDMKNFITHVGLDGTLRNSQVHSDDIAYFAPELANWHRVFSLNGKSNGTLDDFHIRDMLLRSGATEINGDLDMLHMDDLANLTLDFRSKKTITNHDDLVWLIPSLGNVTQIQLAKLGALSFAGTFNGTLQDFKADGNIQSDLGNLNFNMKMLLPETSEPVYEGEFKTDQFDLGTLTGNKSFGKLTTTAKIEGTGFDWRTMDTRFQLDIPSIHFNNYTYRNAKVDGSMKLGNLKTLVNVNDTNLILPELEANYRFNAREPGFNIFANLQYANLKAMGWLNQAVELSGNFNLDFKGNQIDSIEGIAQMDQIRLLHQNRQIPISKLVLSAFQDQKGRNLSVVSDQFKADITGRYKLMDLPDAFMGFLNRYYPSYIPKPARQIANQFVHFNLETKEVSDILQLINPEMKGGNQSTIEADLDMQQNLFSLKASVPFFAIAERSFQDIQLNSTGSQDTLKTNIEVRKFNLTNDLEFPSTILKLVSTGDQTNLSLKSEEGMVANQIDLNARIQTFEEGALFHFDRSTFFLNDKEWNIAPEGEVSIRGKQIHVDRFMVMHDQEKLSLSTEMDDETNETKLIAKIDQVNVEDFLPIFFKEPYIQGRLTGTATLQDPFQKNKLDFIGKLDSLRIEKEYVGGLLINGKANPNTGIIEYHASTTDTVNRFELIGRYALRDSSMQQMMNTITGEKVNLSILQPYLSDVFCELEGTAKTNLSWWGNDDHAYLTGSALVEEALLKVDYTQVRYFLNKQPILFEKDAIRLDMLQLRDSMNNTATCSGIIYHRAFDDFEFKNLRLESPRLALLNTTKANNAQFYGQAIGKATLSLNGPLQDLKLVLNAEPMSVDTSHIFLNTSDEKESKSMDYIEFVKIGEVEEEDKQNDQLNILVTVNVKANPACKVDVILDEETGDVIKGQGTGNISVSIGNIEPLKIRGNYELTKGEYTFNFQTYFQKPFVLNRGNINWNGDPFQAIIDIDAAYQAKNVDISSLSNTGGFMQKEDVTIVAHLSGVLQNPNVKFDIMLPEQSEAKRNDVIVKRLADFKNDDNEMNKQVASLLLFNTFLIGNQNFLSQGNASTLFTNTIGGVVSNLLTNFFNRELEKATKGVLSTYININPTLDLQQNASQLQANIRAGLKILLDKRLVVLVGGNLDYNNPIYTQQLERRGLLTPDITIEWMINRDGSLRIVGFNRSSIDFALSQRNRSGLRLSYRKDFNRLADLFSGKKK